MHSARPLAGTPWRACSGWNDTGDDVTCPGDFDFVGFPGLDGGHKPGQVRLGVVHVDPHLDILANLASHRQEAVPEGQRSLARKVSLRRIWAPY